MSVFTHLKWYLETLRVPWVRVLASRTTLAARRSVISLTSALSPYGRAISTATIILARRRRLYTCVSTSRAISTSRSARRADLALDKRERCLAILIAVALMSLTRCIASIAAVLIRAVAIRLNLGARRALEAGWARVKATSVTRSDIVREPRSAPWVTHHDNSLDLLERRRRNEDCRVGDALARVATSTECIVDNLSTLRVANKDKLCLRALLVEAIDLRSNGLSSLLY